jgi:phosphatidylglycerophosphate synthase
MEVDSAFAALLSIAVLRMGEVGPWVLALGGLRYGFLLAIRAWPWLGAPLPESRRRKAVCVVQIGTLVAIVSPVIDPPLAAPLAAAATLLLVWSFAVDALWLARR